MNTQHSADQAFASASALVARQLSMAGPGVDISTGIPGYLAAMSMAREGKIGGTDFNPQLAGWEAGEMAKANAISRAFRENSRAKQFAKAKGLVGADVMAKANLDVGSMTNLAAVTGGQTLGYVSLDTHVARGTVRPNSFTLYQALNKTRANQIVDFWPYAESTGGALPGAAFNSFGSQSNGVVATNAGSYQLNSLNLKLALDGRAITVALASQNSFLDVAEQENTNAALSILSSVDWALYWGNPTLYPNQFQGLSSIIPTRNVVDFQTYYNTYGVSGGLSPAQSMFNLIYEQAGQITAFRQYGQITHAFMSPNVAASLQQLVTGRLNNIVNDVSAIQREMRGIVVDGDLQGMNTRFGAIQFPIDLFINAREAPAMSFTRPDGTNPATLTAPTKPVSVTATVVAASGTTGSAFTAAYAGSYMYAVSSTDSFMNESTLTYSGVAAGVTAAGSVSLAIVPPAANDASNFRVFRSGLGYTNTASPNPASFRLLADIAANGSSTVTFIDLNGKIPGSETVFLLDMDEQDMAIDYRWMLPLTKIELFAQNLYMPWAVAHIGALRVRIPKFHGMIKNFVPENPLWNPLGLNP